jgi:Skp family chaperone for outer membrane proteins
VIAHFFLNSDWQNRIAFAILCASCLSATAVAAESTAENAPAANSVALQEAVVARQAAETRAAELETKLAQTRSELEALRTRYADLYLESQERVRKLRDLDLSAAHLLVEKQDLESGRLESELLSALSQSRKAQTELLVTVREFQQVLTSVLDVLQPSDALRREVMDRFAALANAAERSLKPLSIVAGRGKRDFERRSCRVLAVNDDLQIVVLDSGFAAGIRRGEQIALLRVIEVRPEISAAIVTHGRFNSVGPGGTVTPE